jgi:hypothetical protein
VRMGNLKGWEDRNGGVWFVLMISWLSVLSHEEDWMIFPMLEHGLEL